MCDSDSVVAVYSAHAGAEDAVRQLRKAGYDIRNLSIVVSGYHIEKRVVGFYSAVDRIKQWGKNGIVWGGTLGLLSVAALYVIPGIGSELTDPMAGWIQGALGGALTVGALSTLAAAAYSLSLPKESVLKYDLAIETDDEFLLVAHGTASEAAKARQMISVGRPDELGTPSSALGAPWPGAGAVE